LIDMSRMDQQESKIETGRSRPRGRGEMGPSACTFLAGHGEPRNICAEPGPGGRQPLEPMMHTLFAMTFVATPGRPATGAGHYLRDLVYGAIDGAITTMAVVAGTAGATLSARTGMILGLANLVADGISMGASNYLALKSELQQTGRSVDEEAPWRHGLATLAAFVVVGAIPLSGYALGPLLRLPVLVVASALAGLALLITGAARAPFVRRPAARSAAEMLLVGAVACAAAYLVGALAGRAT
jgi:hypothetical protein